MHVTGPKLAPHTEFGKTRMVPLVVYLDGAKVDADSWDDVLWVERGEDWYALDASCWRGKKIRAVSAVKWRAAKDIEQ